MNSDEPTDADFAGLLDQARGSHAASSRTSRRWLRQQALESARLSGVLLSAAEHGHTLTIRTTSGRTHTGAMLLVGGDFCALRGANGDVLYIRFDAITVVQPDRGIAAVPASDDRGGAVERTLVEELADHAGEQPDVSIVSIGQRDAVPGRLLAVGVDVATLEVDQKRGLAYVALASVAEVWLLSG